MKKAQVGGFAIADFGKGETAEGAESAERGMASREGAKIAKRKEKPRMDADERRGAKANALTG